MKKLIFEIGSDKTVIVKVQVDKHGPDEIGRLVNFRYPDIMLECLSVFYRHHRDWLCEEKKE